MDRPEPWARRTILRALALGGAAGIAGPAAPARSAPALGGAGTSQNTAVIWGDSISAARDGSSERSVHFSARGYWTWAEILSRRRVRLVKNAGVGGEDTGQVLARFDADVRPYGAGWVVIECGTNDLIRSPSVTTMTENLGAMLDEVASVGARAVISTLPPRNGLTAEAREVRARVNHWVRSQPFLRAGVAVADFAQALADPVTGDMPSVLSDDGIHPNGNGAYRCGRLVADILDRQVPPLDVPAHDLDDPLLLSANPAMTGTAGVTGLGVDGEAGDEWSVDTPPLDGGRARLAKVPRADGVPGEWQQVSVSSATRVRLFQVRDDVGGSWTPGTTQVYAVCEFETDPDWSEVTDFHLEVVALNSWLEPQWTVTDLRWTDEDPWLPETRPWSGVLQTPVMTVPASTDKSLVPAVVFNGAGTFRVGRFALYKVA